MPIPSDKICPIRPFPKCVLNKKSMGPICFKTPLVLKKFFRQKISPKGSKEKLSTHFTIMQKLVHNKKAL